MIEPFFTTGDYIASYCFYRENTDAFLCNHPFGGRQTKIYLDSETLLEYFQIRFTSL